MKIASLVLRALPADFPEIKEALARIPGVEIHGSSDESGRIVVTVEDGDGWSLRVVGKGGHVRYVPLPPVLAGELHSLPRGYAFPSPRGGHLTPHHLAKIVTRHLPAGVSTHTLRHRCATVAYAGTRDLRAVQELLGHSRPETTAGYAYVPQNAVRAAMQAAAHYG